MSIRSSLNLFDRLVKDRVLSPDGKEWLLAAIDPYHDYQLSLRGYPDTNVSGSVVQVVKQSLTLNAPGDVSGNWDANIFSLPICQDSQVVTAAIVADTPIVLKNTNNAGTISMLNCLTAASGSTVMNCTGFIASGGAITNSWLAPNGYTSGPYRVISSGFEVVNTTADIDKQGTVTVYRVPQGNQSPLTYLISDTSSGGCRGAGSLRNLSDVPPSVSSAMLLPGTRQWAAREGVYCPVTFSTPDLPVQDDATCGVIMTAGEPARSTGICVSQIVENTAGQVWYFSQTDFSNQNTTGAFFTGLSNTTTLTVNHIIYIERFPNPQDSDLVVLAQPSPRYDLAALELYSECLADMPVGVMQKENGLGDWIKSAVSKVSGVLTPVLRAIPHPAAQAGALISAGAGDLVSSMGQVAAPSTFVSSSDACESQLAALMRQVVLLQKKIDKKKKRTAMSKA